MGSEHTFHTFDQELAELRRTIERMGRLAESQFADAMRAITGSDADLATAVIGRDAEIDRLESQAESMAVRLLALRQPMAGD